MLRRLGIRWKILAILAVPIAVLTAGALLISLTAVSDSRSTRQVSNLINAAEDMRSVVESLQHERYASIRLIQSSENASGRDAISNEVNQSRWLTDEALEALRGHINVIDFDVLDERISDLVDETIEIHARLTVLRSRVDADSITESAAITSYNDIIRNDVMLSTRLGGLIDQRDPAQFLAAYSTLDLLIEYLQQERHIGETVINNAERGERTGQDLQTLVALQDALLDDAHSELAALDTEARIPSIVSNLPSMRLLVQTGSSDALSRMNVEAWLESVDRVIENIDPARVEVIEVAAERADQAATDARNQAILTIGGTSIAVLISLALALIVARGIVIPLRRLTGAAEKVRDDLPRLVEQVATPGVAPDTELERIPVESEDEIGKLASAFNSVNETTVAVAQEQAALRGSIAEMFVNVARRDQVLLNRQLSFITQLERTEEDPAQLEDLFRLDHLATRMRRNAESLLVLAGIDSGRRLRNPMAISDVVRTASSEIEHYDRIDLVLTADPFVLGHAALTVAHLLAELMENATVFSDPTSRVEVMTALREDGVAVSITDDGLGMDAAAVADANEKIRSSSASDVIGAQRLGMFVVGRLASRHDIQVHISSAGEGQGTRVDVLVPLALLDPSTLDQHGGIAESNDLPPQVQEMPAVPQEPAVIAPVDSYQPIAQTDQTPLDDALPTRQSDALPVRGGANDLPTRGGEGLPVRGARPPQPQPSAQSQPPAAAASKPEPRDASERAGLFTGFRSVSANPLESLESVDPATLQASQQQAYVPLVSEDRDDFGGLSRATKTEEEAAAPPAETDSDAISFEPEVAYEPEISFDSQPLSARQVEEASEEPEVDDKPQTQIRVYTGAFPTATGEYPTYTGEIPLHTGEVPAYPSRRSRRELRNAEPVASVDHHVEFEPIGIEDDEPVPEPEGELEQPEAAPASQLQAEEAVAEFGTDLSTETSPAEAAPAEPEIADEVGPEPEFGAPSGGFPTIPGPGVGVVQPQPSGSFNQSVLADEQSDEKPKRKRFSLFGRKSKSKPEPEETPVRESRFPGSMTFTPGDAPNGSGASEAASIWPPQPIPTAQPASLSSWSPQAGEPQQATDEQAASEPEREPAELKLPEPQRPEPQLTQRQTAFQPEPEAPAQESPSVLPARLAPQETQAQTPTPPQTFQPQTSWAPNSGNGHGALGAEAAEELRRRSAITSEVLSELSQLSMYQPEAQHAAPASSLTKRVPSEVPKQPESKTPATPARRRDASQVRSMLSGFQAGVNRAQSADEADSVQDREER